MKLTLAPVIPAFSEGRASSRPFLRVFIFLLFFCALFVCPLCSFPADDTQVQALYNKISDQRPSLKTIAQWKEISDLLEEAGVHNEMLIVAYDKQARYPEKHSAMKKYVEALYPKDPEKQAEWVKGEADKLKEQGEVTEAIVLYRAIAKEYAEEIIKEEARKKGVFGKHHPVR